MNKEQCRVGNSNLLANIITGCYRRGRGGGEVRLCSFFMHWFVAHSNVSSPLYDINNLTFITVVKFVKQIMITITILDQFF